MLYSRGKIGEHNMYMSKQCSKCGEVKPITEFYKRWNGYLGVRADCKNCGAKDRIERYNPEEKKIYNLKYRAEQVSGNWYKYLNQLRGNGKKDQVTIDEIIQLLKKTKI
jgi:hypothetical protein